MARPTKLTDPDAPSDAVTEAVTDAARRGMALDDEARIRAALDTLPPDTRVRLYRLNDFTKRRETHGILAPDQTSSEWIARRFGGGRYIVEVLKRNEHGRELVGHGAIWDIPGPYKGVGRGLPGIDAPVNDAAADTDRATAPGSEPPGRPMPTRELIDSALAARVMDVLNRDQRPALDLNGVAALVTAAMPVLEKLLAPKAPTSDPLLRELLVELRADRARTPAAGPTASALHDATRGIREVLQLRDALMPPTSEDKMSMADKLVNALPNLVAAFRGTPLPPPVPELPPGEAPVVSLTNPDGTPSWDVILGGFHDQLLSMASNGWEPDYSAELVMRVLPVEYTGLLNEFLAKPEAEALTILHQAVPELRGYTQWTPDFLAGLRKLNATEEADDPETPEADQ